MHSSLSHQSSEVDQVLCDLYPFHISTSTPKHGVGRNDSGYFSARQYRKSLKKNTSLLHLNSSYQEAVQSNESFVQDQYYAENSMSCDVESFPFPKCEDSVASNFTCNKDCWNTPNDNRKNCSIYPAIVHDKNIEASSFFSPHNLFNTGVEDCKLPSWQLSSISLPIAEKINETTNHLSNKALSNHSFLKCNTVQKEHKINGYENSRVSQGTCIEKEARNAPVHEQDSYCSSISNTCKQYCSEAKNKEMGSKLVMHESLPEVFNFEMKPKLSSCYTPGFNIHVPSYIACKSERQTKHQLSQPTDSNITKSVEERYQSLLNTSTYTRRLFCDSAVGARVDFVKELCAKRNCLNVISVIMSCLSPRNLCVMSWVSRAWRRVCLTHPYANERRLKYLEQRKQVALKIGKENWYCKQKETSSQFQERNPFEQVQNVIANEKLLAKENSDAVTQSPSKSRYQYYIEEAKKLKPGERLQPCPNCQSPSHINEVQKRGHCTRSTCSFDYCTRCFRLFHENKSCPPIGKAAAKKNMIGSKSSRRNLRRL